MADRTTLKVAATGTDLDVMTDERTVATLSGNVAAKVQYVAEIDGTPDSSNVGIIDNTGSRKVVAPLTDTALALLHTDLSAQHADELQLHVDIGTTTHADLTAIGNKLPVLVGGLSPVTGPLTDTQLRAAPVPINDGGGSVTVDGTVSVSGLVPGTGANQLGKAEDSVAADGDVGVMMLAIRSDVPATTVGANGDYHPLEVDANGRLHVTDSSIGDPTNGAAGTDTTNTGLIGLFKRLLQRITTLLAVFPTTIDTNSGVKSASTLRVVLATDQPALTTPMPVSSTPAASELHIGEFGGNSQDFHNNLTTSTSVFVSGNNVGGKQTIANFVRVAGGSAVLQHLTVTDKSAQKAPFDIVFFNADPSATTFTDHAAFPTINAADVAKIIHRISVSAGDYVTIGGVAIAEPQFPGKVVKLAGTDLFYAIVTTGTPTYAGANDVTIGVGALRD